MRDRVALGHGEADCALKGGLARAAMHEVFCEGRQGAAATGFVTGLAGRVTARKPLLWVRQDFSDIETGALSMSGLAEIGLDPRRMVMVRAADVESALRTSADALACDALGAVVLEALGRDQAVRSRGEPQADTGRAVFRRHRPAAADGRATFALDRGDAMDAARGAFAAGHRCGAAWGAPRFDAELLRNRHGPCGRWIMEWKCDECQFSEPAAYPQPVAAAPAHRPHPAVLSATQQRFSEVGTVRVKKTRQIKRRAQHRRCQGQQRAGDPCAG